MTTRRMTQVLLVLIWILSVSGCDKESVSSSENTVTNNNEVVIAEVNGEAIYQSELDEALTQYQNLVSGESQNALDRKQVLDEMINSILLVQYAKNIKIDQDPEVQAIIKRAQSEVLLQVVRHKLLTDKPITNDEINSRLGMPASPESHKSGKEGQIAAQQLRAQTFRALQRERVDELLNELHGKAHIVVN